MVIASDIKTRVCSLFNVLEDEAGVQRIITPFEYSSTGDAVVVRVRSRDDGGFVIDENGEAALNASMAGGDIDCDAVQRWLEDQRLLSTVVFDDDVLYAIAQNELEIAPAIFRMAEAAQQLFTLATSRATRHASDFKARVAEVFDAAAADFEFSYEADFELPIAGGMHADFYIPSQRPLIVIAANSLSRLLEAEIIHMQYQLSKRPGMVVAVAQSQSAVGKKQFERANYYTDKTVSFNPNDMRQLIEHHLTFAQESTV